MDVRAPLKFNSSIMWVTSFDGKYHNVRTALFLSLPKRMFRTYSVVFLKTGKTLKFWLFLEPHLHSVAYPLQFVLHRFLCHRTQLKRHRWATH